MTEIYISTDIEADGPIPGEYSLLSIGAVAFNKEGKMLGEFYKKLKPLQGAKQHPETMKFWKENPEAWKEVNSDQENPEEVIREYVKWCYQFRSESNKRRPIFIAWPATFDFMFVYWYIIKFTKGFDKEFRKYLPFSFAGLDIATYAMSMLKQDYSETRSNNLPERWTKDAGEHTHKAIDDAKERAKIFINMLKENKK